MAANRFAKIEDQYWLDLNFLALMSPENLHADGQRSSQAAIDEATTLRLDYAERCRQLASA